MKGDFWFLLATLIAPTTFPATQTFSVKNSSVVTIGTDRGDSFAVEKTSKDAAVVLLQPNGEACTFRLSLAIGESLNLRAFGDAGQPLLCETSLLAIANADTTKFSARCYERTKGALERKCPREAS